MFEVYCVLCQSPFLYLVNNLKSCFAFFPLSGINSVGDLKIKKNGVHSSFSRATNFDYKFKNIFLCRVIFAVFYLFLKFFNVFFFGGLIARV